MFLTLIKTLTTFDKNISVQLEFTTTRNKSEFTVGVTVCVSFSPLQTSVAVVDIQELVCQY